MSSDRDAAGPGPVDESGESVEGAEGAARRDGPLEWAKSIAIAFVLFLVLRTFVLQTFVIVSGSMENTLLVGDFLVVNRLAIGSRVPFTDIRIPGYSEPRRGDVLVFDPPHTDTLNLVKRLVGVPGDTLAMRGGALFLNGERQAEPYVEHDPRHPDHVAAEMAWQRGYLPDGWESDEYRPSRDEWGPIVVPEGHYFMLGDNRDDSYDSRYWGLLEAWRVQGRVAFTYFSYDPDALKPFRALTAMRPERIGRSVE